MTKDEFYSELEQLDPANHSPLVTPWGTVLMDYFRINPITAVCHAKTGRYHGLPDFAAMALAISSDDARDILSAATERTHPDRPRMLAALGLTEPA